MDMQKVIFTLSITQLHVLFQTGVKLSPLQGWRSHLCGNIEPRVDAASKYLQNALEYLQQIFPTSRQEQHSIQ